MAKVKVLIEGHARQIENGWICYASTTLVESNGKKVIVDPGINRKRLLKALNKENLETSDIDYVFLTHGHLDHALLAGIFENAKVVDEMYTWRNDRIIEHHGTIPGTDLKVISTPGHKEEHCSLIAETEKGTCVVAGDVFWWAADQKQEVKLDEPDEDTIHLKPKVLMKSRRKVLEIADYIIPGHGKPFEVTEDMKKKLTK